MKLSDPGRRPSRTVPMSMVGSSLSRVGSGTERRAILNGSYVIWTIVGVLLIVALLIYISNHPGVRMSLPHLARGVGRP